MNGALTYAVVAIHQTELRAAAERNRRAPRKPRRDAPAGPARAAPAPCLCLKSTPAKA